MSRRRRQSWRLGLLVLGALLGPAVALAQTCTMPPKPPGLVAASVVRVVDGDTIVVRLADGRSTRVRMIGIDAPELRPSEKLWRDAERSHQDAATIQAQGARALEFTRKHLAGRRIEIERDTTAVDRYGRTLAYVWLGEELYNVLIVREGYASLMTVPPNVKYAHTLAACHRVARESRRGLWAARE
jgi:micrococcal nuclease